MQTEREGETESFACRKKSEKRISLSRPLCPDFKEPHGLHLGGVQMRWCERWEPGLRCICHWQWFSKDFSGEHTQARWSLSAYRLRCGETFECTFRLLLQCREFNLYYNTQRHGELRKNRGIFSHRYPEETLFFNFFVVEWKQYLTLKSGVCVCVCVCVCVYALQCLVFVSCMAF